MRRFLIVGCGGSGGATLAFIMDQLRSELHAAGIETLLGGWQFVQIDVPSAPETGPEGLANVPEQGGTYIGCGPQGSSYAILDGAVSQRLAAESALDTIATWAPRNPQEVSIPISAGAGQYRAIGRMITLSKATEIHTRLQAAWDALFRVDTISQMSTVDVPGMGKFDPNEPPLVLVVSSMAGGAGASMALDVCRLLTLVSGLDPKLMGVFMVTPDIFDSLPQSSIVGVRANSLAMLGEIVASQAGSAREHDVRMMRALGHQHGEGELIPFARVFPVGRFIGADRTLFGDGSQWAVYRGLARGLAGLMMSGAASDQFVSYDLGNTASPEGDRDLLGWGISAWDVLPWGTYGFASLSMGRDRYAEYAAQRLARSCVDKLLFGHLQAGQPGVEHRATRLAPEQPVAGALRRAGTAREPGRRADPHGHPRPLDRLRRLRRRVGGRHRQRAHRPAAARVSAEPRGHDRRAVGSDLPSGSSQPGQRTSAGMRRRGLRNGVQLAPRVRRAGRTDGGRRRSPRWACRMPGNWSTGCAATSTTCWPPGWRSSGRWGRPTSSRCRRKWMRRCARCAG